MFHDNIVNITVLDGLSLTYELASISNFVRRAADVISGSKFTYMYM